MDTPLNHEHGSPADPASPRLSILESVGAMVLARDGAVILADEWALRILGLPADNRAGLAASSAGAELLALVRRCLRHSCSAQQVVGACGDSDGVAVRVTPLGHTGGDEGRVLAILSDATASRRSESRCLGFLAEIAHDLRSPLTVMQGYLEGALGKNVSSAARRGYIEVALSQVGVMSAIMEHLLNASAVFAGAVSLERSSVPLDGIVGSVVRECERMAGLKGVGIRIQSPEDVGLAMGDEVALRRVVSNLVVNAVKFTRDGGLVLVALTREGDFLRVAVEDQGPGIAPDELEQIWDAFYTVKAETKELRKGGTGLGLAIVRRLVSQMGGECGGESTPGQGSCFWFTVPAAHPAR